MNSTPRETRIKKLIYQSNYRGCKETDLILGHFARVNLHKLSNDELEHFAELLKLPDTDIYDWYTGKKPLSPKYHNTVTAKILSFYLS